MPGWNAPQRPIEHAEEKLVTAILDGMYAAGDTLPGERDLARELGVTRPTLREALRRLERDGWLTIQQGKPTRVNDYWLEGGPNVLTALVRYEHALPAGFVMQLLEVRQALAPLYIGAAVAKEPDAVTEFLEEYVTLPDTAAAYAAFDWELHHRLTVASGNPIYTLILNGFAGFYEHMAERYFAYPAARAASQAFYAALLEAAEQAEPQAARTVSTAAMRESLVFWEALEREVAGSAGR